VVGSEIVVFEQLSNTADELVPNPVPTLITFWECGENQNRGLVWQAMSVMQNAVNTLDLHGFAGAE
jgi:hypothetical protein